MKNTTIFPVNIKKLIVRTSKILLLVTGILSSQLAFALKEDLVTKLEGSQVAVDSLLRNRDPLMPVNLSDLDDPLDPNWADGISIYRVRNRVKLEVNHYVTDECIPSTFSCSVTVRIKRLDKDYNLDSVEQTLVVTYNNGVAKVYDAVDVYAFEGYHYVEVKILSVSCNSSIAKFLIVKNEIDIERYYEINPSTAPSISSVTYVSATKEIAVVWSYSSGIVPEEYDLEWTFVDNYKKTGEFYTASETNYNFKHNSTRITTTNNTYKISAAFERGFLLFRVRAVGRTGEHFTYRVNSVWSTSAASGLVSSYPSASRIEITSTEEHQPTLNWQFSATFAEEGKKKEIISYFDGSLRNRQTVTRNNTDTTAIVAETIYDHQGRPAINTLPVPAAQNILKYYPDFNLNLLNVPYSRADFDLDTGECTPETPAMSINAGASKYYSVNNPYQDLSSHYKYVPDAFGFAFTQVEYMPDNTGRVSRQSGVGLDHTLGSGHETQYLYGTPFQEELDRLFGNSVGYAEHYQKNMVIDANGQVSVSYLNLAGKTIATSLAGPTPSNVDSLSSFVQPATLKIDLQNSADTTYSEGEITMSKTFVVTHQQVYTFDYSMEADTFDSECLPSNVCLDCVYDLEITLTDICGNNVLDGDNDEVGVNTLKRTIGKIGANYDSACRVSPITYTFDDDGDVNDSINITLEPGVYTITKTLSVNRDAMEWYADVFVRNNTCLKTLDSFKQDYLEATDFSGCGMTCEECVTNLGTVNDFIAEQVTLLLEDSITVTAADTLYLNSLYDSLVENCMDPCREPDPCDLKLQIIKADVSPGGQYSLLAEGSVFADSSLMNPESFKYGGNYRYKNVGTTAVKMQYTDGAGNLDSVLYQDAMTPVADLPYDEFISHFKDSWADSLAQFHPEYCNYQWCIINHSGFLYEQRMLNTETYQKAYDSGYINPLMMLLADYGGTVVDPYFKTTWGGNDSAAIKTTMSGYKTEGATTYSMWEIPLILFHCNDGNQAAINTCLTGLTMSDPSCAPEQNSMWRMFRTLYLAERTKLMEARMSSGVTCSTSLIKQKRFYLTSEAEDLSVTTGSSSTAEANDSIGVHCAQTCEAFAAVWMYKLEGCNLNATDSARLADSLVKICRYGCDANNPTGASSVASAYQSGNTPGYKTFQEAVKALATFVPGICDANLISYPMEYGHDYHATSSPFADTCACENDPSPSADLDCACEEEDSDLKIHLLSEFEIEEEFKCKTCVNCEQLAIALGQLDTSYNMLITDTTIGLRNILETGLNKFLSFNYSYDDYIDFMRECLGDTVLMDSTLIRFRTKYLKYIFPIAGEGGGIDGGGSLEGGESLLSGGGGGGAGLSTLDTCACNLLLDIKRKYDSLGLMTPYNNFYLTEIAARGLSCEVALFDYEAAMLKCKDAYEMDDENLPFHKNRGWSTTQLFNLYFEVSDYELEFPSGCVCASPPPNPDDLDTTEGIPCDSLIKIWIWRRHIHQMTREFYDDNGNLSDPSGYDNFVEDAWDNFQEPYDYFNDDSLDFWGEYERYKRIYCEGQYTPYYPTLAEPPICDNCYVLDTNKVNKALTFLNQLATPYKAANHLVRNGWKLLPTAAAYNDAVFYSGSNATTLKYNIRHWNPFGPYNPTELEFEVKDTFSHHAVWSLIFPSLNRYYQHGYIIEFDDLIPQYPSRCYNNSYSFIVTAYVKKPAKLGGDTVAVEHLWGDVSNIQFYKEDSICEPTVYRCNKPLFVMDPDTGDCRTSLTLLAHHNAEVAYNQYIDSVKKAFRAQYIAQCMEARKTEVFTMRYGVQEYHYTLYYYDQAGNLVQTVPPAGVNMLSAGSLASVRTARETNGTPVLPTHTFITGYNFNTLNQLAKQTTPDGGTSEFWYDAVGRLVVSRNAKQLAQSTDQYSYTVFDALGRITEVGELSSSTAMTVAKAFDPGDLETWLAAADATKEEITRTYYDNVQFAGVQSQFSGGQTYLRKRAVSITYSNTNDGDYQHAVHYSYDVHGYVGTLVREIVALDADGHRYKRIDYQYDLLSGNVHKVMYQHGKVDRFYHRYVYDADNRITNAYTSTDGVTWDNDANYEYYRHGPLMRAEIGELNVQGVDYAYTVQGWLKGVNSNTLYTNRDIGQDGLADSARPWVARDVFGFTLGYFSGDYTPVGSISSTNMFEADYTPSVFNNASANLYNGNIRHMVTTVSVLSGGTPLGSAYRYDQLNRLAKAEYYSNITVASNVWDNSGSALTAYKNTFTYDANGNILTQHRNGHANTPGMDSMTYNYYAGTNKLENVDEVVNSSNYGDDIDDQSDGNYTYDEIGNMISDAAEEIATIQWTVYGKIKSITRTGGSSKPDLVFEYSPDGHRVMKQEKAAGHGPITTTWYARDAQGNIMSIYEERNDSIWLEEQEMFGSSRLGMMQKDLLLNSLSLDTVEYTLKRGEKRYEMSNHLGNVLAVITDKIKGVCASDTVSYFSAEIMYAYDYSPFGAILPDRKYAADTSCTTVIDYDTIYNDHYESSFIIGGLLSSGQTIRMTDGTVTKTLATYNAGYSNPLSYKGQIITNVSPAADGIMYISNGTAGNQVRLLFSADSLGFDCGDMVIVYWGTTPVDTINIDCAVDSTYAVDTITVCNEGTDYRFGFNSMEKDNEAKGVGNSYDFGARIYDSRLGRWMSLDPLMEDYPGSSPYNFVNNSPLAMKDPDGRKIIPSNYFVNSVYYSTLITIIDNKENSTFVKKYLSEFMGENKNLVLRFNNTEGPGATARTSPINKTDELITFNANEVYNVLNESEEAGNYNVKAITELGKAVVIMHEVIIHASRKEGDHKPPTANFDDFVTSIKEFSSGILNSELSDYDAVALALVGFGEEGIANLQEHIKTKYNIEISKEKVDEVAEKLMREDKVVPLQEIKANQLDETKEKDQEPIETD